LTAVGAADREADGVVDQEEEGKAGLVVAEPGSLWWCKDRFGQGEGVRPERVAGLEERGDGGWRSSTARSRWASSLSCWVQGWRGRGGVDLGERGVKDQVLELLLVDVVAERAGRTPRRGQGAHGQRLDVVLGDDGERLGDHGLWVSGGGGPGRSWGR
jgi:hypothetical protein